MQQRSYNENDTMRIPKKQKLEVIEEKKVEENKSEQEKKQENPLSILFTQTEILAQQYYKEKEDITEATRNILQTKDLRNFHNWIKSVLIKKYTSLAKDFIKNELNYGSSENLLSVLELGFGRGGDLRKWAKANIGCIVGVDISYQSLQIAFGRAQLLDKRRKFAIRLIEESASQDNDVLFKKIDPPGQKLYFDIISAQFCSHYMFDSEKSARNFFSNMTSRLLRGGYIILTFPDSNVLVKKMRHLHQKTSDGYVYSNKYFSMKFKNLSYPKNKAYGLEYGFYLEDAVGEKDKQSGSIQYVPEYLIEMQNFIKLSREYGLKMLENQNFIDFFGKNKNIYQDLFKQMLIDYPKDGKIDDELWDVTHCYRVIVFQQLLNMEVKEFNRGILAKIKNQYETIVSAQQ